MNTLAMKNSQATGWSGQLQLEYALRQGRTVLTRNRHIGPLVVQCPLYPEDDVCHTCILHPPGGVVGGDRLEIELLAGEGTATLITTPGATKFYRSAGKKAVQEQRIKVEDGAVLEWFPQDNIFFSGANAALNTRIDLAPEACFMGWEILCLGLPVNEETFDTGQLTTSFIIHRQKIPLFIDRLRINSARDLKRRAGLRNFPVTATFMATGCKRDMLATLRSLNPLEDDALYGITLLDDLLVARYLGFSTFAAHGLFTQTWKILRPQLTDRVACVPRIWAT